MKRTLNAIKQLSLKDFLAPFVFLLLFLPSAIFRLLNKIKKRQLWLIAEGGEARDNGYHFYKYVRENHPSDFCFYAIDPKSAGYKKVAKLGNVIKYGGLKHWLYYMSANLNISSQKSGNPCPMFWYFMHVILGLYRNRMFLQHGITKDDADWLYYKKTKFKYFVCGAKREYDFINEKFGYPEGSLLFTGFPRWDALKDTSMEQKEKSILIMPTWRNWLGGEKNKLFETKNFNDTEFFKCWDAFLNNVDFIKFIEKNNIKVYFYPHINMQMFLDNFKSKSKNIKIISLNEDIQMYLNKCSLMITDYSSVAFDFAYLGKVVVYYQFDKDDYRKRQYAEGYFIYERDGFGPVVQDVDALVGEVENYFDKMNNRTYCLRCKKYFLGNEIGCSEKIYLALHGNHKKKVLHVSYTLARGGIETYMMGLIKGTQRDYDNIVIYYDGDNHWSKELEDNGVRTFKVSGGKMGRFLGIIRCIRKEKVDIVYSYTFYDSALVMLAALFAGVKKRIVHSHRTRTDEKIQFFKKNTARLVILATATDKLACSESAGEALYAGGNYVVVKNGIDWKKYKYNESVRKKLRAKMNLEKTCLTLGVVGWINQNKNQMFAIEILKALLGMGVDCKLILFGDEKENGNIATIQKRCKELGLSQQVLFMGAVDNMFYYYNVCDLVLIPSLWEAFPYVAIEAQANGVSVIASFAVPNSVKINENFCRKSINDGARGWADTAVMLAGKRVEPNTKGQIFSVDKMIDKVRNIYEG